MPQGYNACSHAHPAPTPSAHVTDGGEAVPEGTETDNGWYVVRVFPRTEKRVAEELSRQDSRIETDPLLRMERHKWSDRIRKVEVPLIRQYIFVRCPERLLSLIVRRTPHVMEVLHKAGVSRTAATDYAMVPQQQLDDLRRVAQEESMRLRFEENDFRVGREVEFYIGDLKGIKGQTVAIRTQQQGETTHTLVSLRVGTLGSIIIEADSSQLRYL